MADIFISYKREDIALARSLAGVLSQSGYTVWWDHDIPAGKDYDQVIEEALGSARCVIVFWSAASINSRNVKDEANEGLKRNVLIPVLIGTVTQPLGFRMIQALQWANGNSIEQSEMDELLMQVKNMIGSPIQSKPIRPVTKPYIPTTTTPTRTPQQPTRVQEDKPERKGIGTGLIIACICIIALLLFIMVNNRKHTGKHDVAGRPSTTSATATTSQSPSSSLPGKFPQGSERVLSPDDLSGLSKWDLKIMRNEIFARHGFIFKTNDMRSYFAAQTWYQGTNDDVNNMLSDIETRNVALIKRFE